MEIKNEILKEVASLLATYQNQITAIKKQATSLVDYVSLEGQEQAVQAILNNLPSLDAKYQLKDQKPASEKK